MVIYCSVWSVYGYILLCVVSVWLYIALCGQCMVIYCSVRSMYGYVLLCKVNLWLDAWQQSCGRIVTMSPTHIILLIFIFFCFQRI